MTASLAIAVSFAAGLNVYAVLLTLGLMGRLGWIVLPSGLESVAHTWVIVAACVMFAAEFVADKIPGFDLAWNAAHTLIRIPLAALLAYGIANHLTAGQQIFVAAMGAVIASVAHGSKLAARVLVTPSPEPVSNAALSVGEDILAVAMTWSAMHFAVIAGVISVVMLICGVVMMVFAAKLWRKFWRRMRDRRREFFA